MKAYVGMDVHRNRTQVAILDGSGKELSNRIVANDPSAVLASLAGLEPGTAVALEACYGWGWLADLLADHDFEPHLAHPLGCKAIAAARLKNDRVDARILAHLLRTDLLPEAWIAPAEVRELRGLLRHRATLVRARTSAKLRIHALLADRGLRCPGSPWTAAGRAWLRSLALTPVRSQILQDNLDLLDTFATLLESIEAQIRASARPDPRVTALMHLPGVGLITAMTLVAEIGDIGRFPDARRLCSWAGLTPTVRNSDRNVRHGHVSKQGPAPVRHVLIEAARVARTHPDFAEAFARIANRRGPKIATVAIARRLLARSYHVLKEVPIGED